MNWHRVHSLFPCTEWPYVFGWPRLIFMLELKPDDSEANCLLDLGTSLTSLPPLQQEQQQQPPLPPQVSQDAQQGGISLTASISRALRLPGDASAGGMTGRGGIDPAEILQALSALPTDQSVSAQGRVWMIET